MFVDLLKTALVGVPDAVKKLLEQELKHQAEEFLAKTVIKTVAHNMLKGIDDVIAASVHVLSSDQVARLAGAYRNEIDRQFVQLNQAVATYIPLQVAVEMAKKQHGNNSPEANAARAKRAAGIDEVKTEFGDLFAAIVGEHVTD
jgi:hypothetical protein